MIIKGLDPKIIQNRTKEIGIRKINGAKSIEIFSLLSKEYIKLVTISLIIASPVAWYATNIWLQGFVYRVRIGWWVFALADAIVMVIVILTVGFQSYRAASKNPVEALRYEEKNTERRLGVEALRYEEKKNKTYHKAAAVITRLAYELFFERPKPIL